MRARRTLAALAVFVAVGVWLWRAPSRGHVAGDEGRVTRVAAAAKHPWFLIEAGAHDDEPATVAPDTAALELRGVVRDAATRAPVPNAEVRFYRHRELFDATTADASGRFLLPPQPPDGQPWVEGVAARADGWAPGVTWIDASNRADLEILLDRAVTLAGRVVDSRENGAADVEVDAFAHSADLLVNWSTRVRTDDAGAFRLVDVPAGAIRIRAVGSHGRATVELPPVAPGSVVDDLLVALSSGARIRGVVRDAGVPVAGADVICLRAAHGATTSAEDGRFELDAIEPGEHDLLVAHPAHGMARTHLTVTEDEDLVQDVDLAAGATLRGAVRDETGAPIADASISALCGIDASIATRTAAGGRFEIRGLPCDSASVEVYRDGFVPMKLSAVPVPSVREIVLSRGRGAEGTIVDARGNVLATPDVFVVAKGDEDQQGFIVLRTRAGHVRVQGLIGGEYYAEVTDRTLGTGRAHFIASSPPASFRIEMSGTAVAVGRVTTEDGSPIAGAFVGATFVSSGRLRLFQTAFEARSDADGRFRVVVPTSAQRLLAVDPSFAPTLREGLVFDPGDVVDVGVLVMHTGDGDTQIDSDAPDDEP